MFLKFDFAKPYIKFNPSKPIIDNLVFKLHYRATFLILVLASLLVSSREFIGEHIRCLVDAGVPARVVETFCFFTTTFTIAKHFNDTLLEREFLPHPGVGPMADTDEATYHAYYQWVPFVLFGQAIAFYLPHLIWKKYEGGRIGRLMDGLQLASLALEEEELKCANATIPSKKNLQDKINTIKEDFLLRLYATRPWSSWLIFCEFLNLCNLALQVYWTDLFLGGKFMALGTQLVGVDWEGMVDPLDLVFPKVTKCHFFKYGPSGSIQKHDALCVMALNIINEKIYTFLWFWYLLLGIATIIGLIWRAMTFFLHAWSTKFNQFVFSNACPGKLNPWNVLTVTKHCHFADWLFLYYLAKNMDAFVFRKLFVELAYDMERMHMSPMPGLSSDASSSIDESNMDTLKLEKESLTGKEKAM